MNMKDSCADVSWVSPGTPSLRVIRFPAPVANAPEAALITAAKRRRMVCPSEASLVPIGILDVRPFPCSIDANREATTTFATVEVKAHITPRAIIVDDNSRAGGNQSGSSRIPDLDAGGGIGNTKQEHNARS